MLENSGSASLFPFHGEGETRLYLSSHETTLFGISHRKQTTHAYL